MTRERWILVTALGVSIVGGLALALVPRPNVAADIAGLVARHVVAATAGLLVLTRRPGPRHLWAGAILAASLLFFILCTTAALQGRALLARDLAEAHTLVFALGIGGLAIRELRRPAPVKPAPGPADYEAAGRFGLASRLYERRGSLERAAPLAARAGEWERAADLYRRIGDERAAADAYYRAGRISEAADMYEIVEAYGAAARAREEAGQLEAAARLYERAGETPAAVRVTEAAGLAPSGDLLERAGRVRDAVAAWRREGRWEDAARALEALREPLEAAGVYAEAGAWMRAGRLYEAAGNLEAAGEAYRRTPEGRVEAARLHVVHGRIAAAAALLDGAPVPAEPDRALTLARLFARLGRWDDAIRVLQGLARQPECEGEVFVLLGTAYLRRELAELAVPALEAALQRGSLAGPRELEARYLLADALERLGRRSEARRRFKEVLERDADYRDVETRYRRLRRPRESVAPSQG